MKGKWKLIFGAVGVVLLLIIVAQNTEQVDTQILFFSITMPRALLLFFAAAIGFVVGILAAASVLGRGKKSEDAAKAE